jgi:hypothetical protein
LNVNCNGNKLCETVMLNSIKSKIVSEGNAESGHSWIKKEKEKVTKINTSRTDKISSESGTNSHCHTANIRNKTNFMES